MNNKNSQKVQSSPKLIRKILRVFKKAAVKTRKYILRLNNRHKLGLFSIFAATVAIIILITYGIVNWQSSKNTPPINTTTISTQSSDSQPIQPPAIGSSSPIPNSSSLTPPIVPSWAKNSISFQPPLHRSIWDNNRGISYYPDHKPLFQPSKKLTAVVDKILNKIKTRKLSTNNLSITLIDANTNEIAEYQQDRLRFPASIAKMFWLVTLQGQIEAKMWDNPVAFDSFADKMMTESDNDSSSFIIDNITGSYSSKEQVPDKILKPWLKQRQFRINEYFKAAAYNPNINLTQKTYPIPYLELSKPTGNELQIRNNPANPSQPIRNSLTTFDAARLMYEACYQNQAVSKAASLKICSLLKRNLDKKEWSKIKADDFNPIQSFFGESLPNKNINFYSKAGWVPTITRAEVCLVERLDRNKSYVLAIFAEDPAIEKDKTIFPEISKLVFNEMK